MKTYDLLMASSNTLHNIMFQVSCFLEILKKPSIHLNDLSSLILCVFSALLHQLLSGSRPFTAKLKAVFLTMAGQVISSSLKEVLGRAAPFRHIYLFWQRRCWPRQSEVTGE